MERHVEIRLEVEPESDPIAGELRDSRGERSSFRGWLQMTAAIEAARSVGADEATTSQRRRPAGREGERSREGMDERNANASPGGARPGLRGPGQEQ
jgi:hypothetical protein